MSESCPAYCGVACVSGSCPNALHADHPQLYPDWVSCSECPYNKGCADCAWAGTGICEGDPDE